MSIFITCLCIVMLLLFGFILGVTYTSWMMVSRAMKCRIKLEETAESRRLMPKYQTAIAFAAQCWCDPRTLKITMDTDLAMVFVETLSKYIDALQWCSGADDFQFGGKGYVGFDKICRPLMSAEGLQAHLNPVIHKKLLGPGLERN